MYGTAPLLHARLLFSWIKAVWWARFGDKMAAFNFNYSHNILLELVSSLSAEWAVLCKEDICKEISWYACMFVHMCVSLCIKPYSNFCKRNWIFCHAIMANFGINVKTVYFFLFRWFPVLRRKGPLCRSIALDRKWANFEDVWRSRNYKTNEANHKCQMLVTHWLRISSSIGKHDFLPNKTAMWEWRNGSKSILR